MKLCDLRITIHAVDSDERLDRPGTSPPAARETPFERGMAQYDAIRSSLAGDLVRQVMAMARRADEEEIQ